MCQLRLVEAWPIWAWTHHFIYLFFFFFCKWQKKKKKKQRTSGPANAHLTPGPGIYFNAFIHVYSPRAGADNPWGQMLMSTESLYHFAHLLQVLKQSLHVFFFFFFHVFPHVYTCSPGQGQTNSWGQNFNVNRRSLSFVAIFEKIPLNSDFIHIFNVFSRVYSSRAGADHPWDQNFDPNRKALSL